MLRYWFSGPPGHCSIMTWQVKFALLLMCDRDVRRWRHEIWLVSRPQHSSSHVHTQGRTETVWRYIKGSTELCKDNGIWHTQTYITVIDVVIPWNMWLVSISDLLVQILGMKVLKLYDIYLRTCCEQHVFLTILIYYIIYLNVQLFSILNLWTLTVVESEHIIYPML
jgi:hypothetical protein